MCIYIYCENHVDFKLNIVPYYKMLYKKFSTTKPTSLYFVLWEHYYALQLQQPTAMIMSHCVRGKKKLFKDELHYEKLFPSNLLEEKYKKIKHIS